MLPGVDPTYEKSPLPFSQPLHGYKQCYSGYFPFATGAVGSRHTEGREGAEKQNLTPAATPSSTGEQ